ncbi:ABC transporter permease [Haliovirga abyssi]|uniref:ABC transporter permease n=1 Tax=Haliovirga abyssi TaxID=2996794 RepID=A0AAU9D4D0_9FUSO|nr:ABC transporter permease [Haliovirga abyssi]BDU50846.1 ABC transporter permease [Haliovirga abyssi]
MNNKLKEALIPVLSVFIAMLIGGGVIAYLGKNPFTAYMYLFQGAFVGKREIAQTLLMSTPLIFTGLSVAFAFKAGLFNIGSQGQMVAGGLAAVAVAAFVKTPLISNVVIAIIAAAAAGFIWAGISGWLKAKLGVHEVISTIMLNYIAINFEQYLLNYPFKEGGVAGPSPVTPPISAASKLPSILPPTSLNFGFIIAILAAITIWYILEKTVLGYEIKAIGFNPTASENAGINVVWGVVLAMGISGILAGLGGAERVLGGIGQDRYISGLMASYGFDGIAVALLGKNNPFGIIVAAILFGALRAGAMKMQFLAGVPSQIIIIIQAVIILLVASENMFKALLNRKKVS